MAFGDGSTDMSRGPMGNSQRPGMGQRPRPPMSATGGMPNQMGFHHRMNGPTPLPNAGPSTISSSPNEGIRPDNPNLPPKPEPYNPGPTTINSSPNEGVIPSTPPITNPITPDPYPGMKFNGSAYVGINPSGVTMGPSTPTGQGSPIIQSSGIVGPFGATGGPPIPFSNGPIPQVINSSPNEGVPATGGLPPILDDPNAPAPQPNSYGVIDSSPNEGIPLPLSSAMQANRMRQF